MLRQSESLLVWWTTAVKPHESRAVMLAFLCNFVLLASYYILRPLRDTMATVFGANQLQVLFTGTFFITLVCAPLFSAVAARVQLSRLIPGLFWFWTANILLFFALFEIMPQSRWLAAAYYWWFSVANLFLISVFWTFMADLFSDSQATRIFSFIAAAGSTGAILGPLITKLFVVHVGVGGLLLVAAAGFMLIVALVHMLMREKENLRRLDEDAQQTTLTHALPGNPLDGFGLLFSSRMMINQALFMLLMTWIATVMYFLQTELIASAYVDVAGRAMAFADIDLVVNIAAALIAVFGTGKLMRRYGVTFGLALSPLLMLGACLAIAAAPSLALVQGARGLQRVTQYAVARPAREILFTVADQESKYKAKNVIDTTIYRFGDLIAAWMQTAIEALGFGMLAVAMLGVGISVAWIGVALALGARFERIRSSMHGATIEQPAAAGSFH
jgi:AAA family ATP:ADP antiporter